MSDEIKELKFGDVVENGYASEDNPHRIGMFVKYKFNQGKINPGQCMVLTDGKGDFWEISKNNDRLSIKHSLFPVNFLTGTRIKF